MTTTDRIVDIITPRLDRFFAPSDPLLARRLVELAAAGNDGARLAVEELLKDADKAKNPR